MGKGKNRLKLIIRIGPYGIEHPSDVYFTTKNVPMQKLYDLSRGEGNVLCFTLTSSDLSTNFAEALESGEIVEELSRGIHKLHWDIEGMRKIEEEEYCETCDEELPYHVPGCPSAPQHFRAEWEKRAERHWPSEDVFNNWKKWR
jgi:hypothetical protein